MKLKLIVRMLNRLPDDSVENSRERRQSLKQAIAELEKKENQYRLALRHSKSKDKSKKLKDKLKIIDARRSKARSMLKELG